MPSPSARGRFYVLDGIDGCGKSTQAARLAQALARPGAPAVLHVREPGTTLAGERIRELVLDPRPRLAPATQTLLFAAARRQLLEEEIEPALAAGRDVVCERFHAATVAYQGAALGLGEERVLALLRAWAGEPAPDLYVVLDLEPEVARERRGKSDRFEAQPPSFHAALAASFRRYAEEVEGAVRVSAAGTPEEVAARVWREVQHGHR
jgi:dTMP kinase